MGRITIEIETGGAAFHEPGFGSLGRDEEVSHVLGRLAERIHLGGIRDGMDLVDTNGNSCGVLFLDDVEDATPVKLGSLSYGDAFLHRDRRYVREGRLAGLDVEVMRADGSREVLPATLDVIPEGN